MSEKPVNVYPQARPMTSEEVDAFLVDFVLLNDFVKESVHFDRLPPLTFGALGRDDDEGKLPALLD